MSASVRPERPSIESLIGEPQRPSIESLLSQDAQTPLQRALRRHDPSAVARIVGRQNANDAEASEEPSYATQALGGLSSLSPLTGLSALTRSAGSGDIAAVKRLLGNKNAKGQTYRDALTDIEGAEETAHPAVRTGNRIIGQMVAAGAMPGGPKPGMLNEVLKGTQYGIASGLLQADPDANVEERVGDAAKQGAIYGAVPLVARSGKAFGGTAVDVAGSAVGSRFFQRRLANRFTTAIADATKATPKVTPAVEVGPVTPTESAIETVARAGPGTPPAPKSPVSQLRLEPQTPAAPIGRDEAGKQLQILLQGKLDEDASEIAARRMYDEASNPDLMRRIEQSLLLAKRQRAAGRSH